MNDILTFAVDDFGIRFVSAPASIYLSWGTVTALVVLAFVPRVVRAIRRAVKSRKPQTVTEWAREESKRISDEATAYTW